MNRIIKFKYLYPTGENGKYEAVIYTLAQIEHHSEFAREVPEYKLLWTGLTDKNGTDIFEGDLLANNGNKPAEVIFRDGCFYADHYGCELWRFAGNKKEVIGNIYSNPELLEGGVK